MVNFDDLIIPFLENLWIFILSNSRYIIIQGADKKENEIAQEVAKELDRRGYGKKKREKSPSLIMSPYGFTGGY